MASFKDALIRDLKATVSHSQQNLPPRSQWDHTVVEGGLEIDVEEIPDIDKVELPKCEKFENLYLIGKVLGESVPLKTIISKTKMD